jgi:hypothetical protein
MHLLVACYKILIVEENVGLINLEWFSLKKIIILSCIVYKRMLS